MAFEIITRRAGSMRKIEHKRYAEQDRAPNNEIFCVCNVVFMIILQDQVLVPVDYPPFPQYHGEMLKAK